MTIPLATSLHSPQKLHRQRFLRALRAAPSGSGAVINPPYSRNTHYDWRLPHGSRQGGIVHGLRITLPKKDAPDEPEAILEVLRQGVAHHSDPDILAFGLARLADFHLAAAAATCAEGGCLRVTAATPFDPADVTNIDGAFKKRPIPQPPHPDLPEPAYAWFKVHISWDESTRRIIAELSHLQKAVEFDEIDTMEAMTAVSNLPLSHLKDV